MFFSTIVIANIIVAVVSIYCSPEKSNSDKTENLNSLVNSEEVLGQNPDSLSEGVSTVAKMPLEHNFFSFNKFVEHLYSLDLPNLFNDFAYLIYDYRGGILWSLTILGFFAIKYFEVSHILNNIFIFQTGIDADEEEIEKKVKKKIEKKDFIKVNVKPEFSVETLGTFKNPASKAAIKIMEEIFSSSSNFLKAYSKQECDLNHVVEYYDQYTSKLVSKNQQSCLQVKINNTIVPYLRYSMSDEFRTLAEAPEYSKAFKNLRFNLLKKGYYLDINDDYLENYIPRKNPSLEAPKRYLNVFSASKN